MKMNVIDFVEENIQDDQSIMNDRETDLNDVVVCYSCRITYHNWYVLHLFMFIDWLYEFSFHYFLPLPENTRPNETGLRGELLGDDDWSRSMFPNRV